MRQGKANITKALTTDTDDNRSRWIHCRIAPLMEMTAHYALLMIYIDYDRPRNNIIPHRPRP